MDWDIREIPTANPTFSTKHDKFVTITTLPYFGRHLEVKFIYGFGDILTARSRRMFALCRQRHFWVGHDRKCDDNYWNRFASCVNSKDIFTSALRFRFRDRPLGVSDIGRCLVVYVVAYLSRAWSKCGEPVEFASQLFSFKSYSTSGFRLWFRNRHFEFRMSADVGPCRQCHVYFGP